MQINYPVLLDMFNKYVQIYINIHKNNKYTQSYTNIHKNIEYTQSCIIKYIYNEEVIK